MISLTIPKHKVEDASESAAEIFVLVTMVKEALDGDKEVTDIAFAVSAIIKLAGGLNSSLYHLLNDENGKAKS
ncbi:hypothetical protein [Yersinia massiliensis]|uniref:Uncharacterized protein n=1 Tax=Yersinia massiliensis TaxID=419257 RepID=A0ABM6UUK6_9GAMM|nr:hypothetical protein [Yersinia massiliensis]AVX38545.1 hypothetical protein DA391_13240 [Yersinia massiliensis]